MYSQYKDPVDIKIEKLQSEVRKQQILSIPVVNQLSPNDRDEVIKVGSKLLDVLEVPQIARIIENELIRRNFEKKGSKMG